MAINHSVAREALQTFEWQQCWLEIHVNRARSMDCAAKIDQEMRYFFINIAQQNRYMNKATADEFTRIAGEKYPGMKYGRTLEVVDLDTDVAIPDAPKDVSLLKSNQIVTERSFMAHI